MTPLFFHIIRFFKILYCMNLRGQKISPFFISVVAVITISVAIILVAVSCAGSKITFKTTFYFVCYSVEDNAVSASSVSSAVSNYGGAGYILEYDGEFYVTVSCYYAENDAKTVCESLKRRDLQCEVLEVSTDEYALKSASARQNAQLYLGNLNTLQSLSALAYECANALDTGVYGQSNAKSVISDIGNALEGLLTANEENCFSTELRRLIAECRNAGGGYVYSKDMRKLQIAIADVIINAKLY